MEMATGMSFMTSLTNVIRTTRSEGRGKKDLKDADQQDNKTPK